MADLAQDKPAKPARKKSAAKKAAPKRSATPKATSPKDKPKTAAKKSIDPVGAEALPVTPVVAASVSPEQRSAMIAEAAYLRAESRGFAGGDPMADWLSAEAEVDALIARRAAESSR